MLWHGLGVARNAPTESLLRVEILRRDVVKTWHTASPHVWGGGALRATISKKN
jgi:hypothetical protein